MILNTPLILYGNEIPLLLPHKQITILLNIKSLLFQLSPLALRLILKKLSKKSTTFIGALKIPKTLAGSTKGWKVGQPINNLTRVGQCPKWGAVRQRHWKNKAHLHENGVQFEELIYDPTPKNIARMKKGLAPQELNKKTGKMESIELHHIPAQKDGGLFNFTEVTPAEHAIQDKFRHIR